MAQIWADQCAGVIYTSSNDAYPKISHERGFERTTSRYHSPPGVGQNIAWALTKELNFTRIIDDLWYRDVSNILPGQINEFEVKKQEDYFIEGVFKKNTRSMILGLVILS